MLEKHYPLIEALADGQFHSGTALAQRFGVSRTAIWKQLKQLDDLAGLHIDAVTGRGYRLRDALELLQKSVLTAQMDAAVLDQLDLLQILSTTTSTNDYLRAASPPALARGAACFAEHQSAGRGRRGRQWLSTYGRDIILSLSWTFPLPLSQLSGLSIALGTVIAEVLFEFGLQDIALKWPNDLHVGGKKIAGILVEASGELEGPSQAIIGMGLNLSSDDTLAIDQPWTAMDKEMTVPPSRNQLAARLLGALIGVCNEYSAAGLPSFLPRWRSYDRYHGKQVVLFSATHRQRGEYQGVDSTGGVILLIDGQRKVFHSGEISLRLDMD